MPEIPPTTTIGGYAVLLVLAACTYYFVGHQRKNKNLRKLAPKQTTKVEPRKETKAKRARKDGSQSSGDQAVKSSKKVTKKKTQQAVKSDREEQATTAARAPPSEKDDDEVDNKEFARQLSNAKAGTNVASKSQAASRPKSVKQGKAQEKAKATSSDNLTAPSSTKSTTGDDADDDESPLNSPELAATTVATPVNGGDVSDMLEKPAGGPSVLKINAPTNPSQSKKASQAKETVVEGKQQKKNRKKAEAAKALKEQAEVERKQKLQQQLKTARVAEGRSAKDGSSFLAAQAPSSSAWTPPAAPRGTSSSSNVELLDTYESSSSDGPATKQQPGALFTPEITGTELLTDEEAVARVMKETAEWEEVKTKGKKSRANKAPQETKEAKETKEDVKPAQRQPRQGGSATVERTTPAAPDKDWDVETASDSARGHAVTKKPVVMDSEWVVA